MITKQQIVKQLNFAKKLLSKIKKEKANGSIAYGPFAIEVQQSEVYRLTELLNNKNYENCIVILFLLCYWL